MWEFKTISFLSGTEVARHKQQRFKVSAVQRALKMPCGAVKPLEFSPSGAAPSAPWAGWAEVALGPRALREGWGWIWRTAVGPSARSRPAWKGTKDTRQTGSVQGGSCTRAGRDEGKTVPFQQQSVRKLAIPAGPCLRFPDGYSALF